MAAKTDKKEVITKGLIKCPFCGAEYSPSEIFMPGELIGKADNVIKDPTGRILYTEWAEEPEATERFVCEQCEKTFVVEATISYKTRAEEEEADFDNLETSLLD